PKMAIIPAGTTNDYARALKIPRDNLKAAAEVILKKQTIKMDIGQARENYFINIAAGGHLTELTYDVPSELKSIFGYLAYLAKGAELLPRVKPIKMHLKYDEGEYKGNASMFFLALTNSVGGFEQIAPDAKLDDGKFSLIIVKTANIFEIVHLVALMLNGGKHINDKRIIYTKTSHLEVDTIGEKNQLMINLDGEYGGDAPMTFVNHHHHIEMYANLDAIPDDAVVGYEEEEAEYEEVSRDFIKEVEKLTDEDIDGDGKIADQNDKK
ncbi:MAG: diacylglycerol kinase, partial [Enterococcus sp.]